jgi:hypothetical protein
MRTSARGTRGRAGQGAAVAGCAGCMVRHSAVWREAEETGMTGFGWVAGTGAAEGCVAEQRVHREADGTETGPKHCMLEYW